MTVLGLPWPSAGRMEHNACWRFFET